MKSSTYQPILTRSAQPTKKNELEAERNGLIRQPVLLLLKNYNKIIFNLAIS